MSDIVYMRASFAGEEYAYDPLLTVRVWKPDTAVLAGVYRTDTTLYPDLEPHEPSRCLLVATWNRDDDMARGIAAYHAGGDDGVRDYLAFGPQLDVSLLFTSETRTPELHRITSEFLDAMSAGVTITPAANDSPAADWWGSTPTPAPCRCRRPSTTRPGCPAAPSSRSAYRDGCTAPRSSSRSPTWNRTRNPSSRSATRWPS